MTTICVKDRVIAADTRATGGSYMAEGFQKIFEVNGEYIGMAGEVCRFPEFLDYYTGETDEAPDIEGMEIIVMDKKGNVSIFEGKCVRIPLGKMGAIGTGTQFAMGAMSFGASAVEGVKIASRLDENTGGKVVHKSLKGKRR